MTFEEWYEQMAEDGESVNRYHAQDAYSVGFNEGAKETFPECVRQVKEDYSKLREAAQAIIAEASKGFGFLKPAPPIPKELIDALKDAVLEAMK